MGNNNLSRKRFRQFCEENKFERENLRNVFFIGEQKVVYAEGNSVRQMYDDCHAVYLNGNLYERKDLKIGSVTRVSPSGVIARQANVKQGEKYA